MENNAPLRSQRIGVIGCGKMGQALIRGLLSRGFSRKSISASDSDAKMRRAASLALKIRVDSDNKVVASKSSVLLLAIKPQQFPELLDSLAAEITSRHLVISIAAGITLGWLQDRLPKAAVIRVMPNLPATVGCGFSAIACGRRAKPQHKQMAIELFSAVGEAVELPEHFFDAITAVSGSGPAYVFWLIQAWEKAAAQLGLPESVARRAIRSTLKGSEHLLALSGADASELIRRVASKGGTTEAALKVLEKSRAQAYFIEALKKASARSRQLSWS